MFFGVRGKRYHLFWMGGKEKSEGVAIFAAEKFMGEQCSVENAVKE